MKLKDIISEGDVLEAAYSNVVYNHSKRLVIATAHAIERYAERIGKRLSWSQVCDNLFAPMIEKILSLEKKGVDPVGRMLVYSKKLDQAVIVSYTDSFKGSRTKDKRFYIITYLPFGRKNPSYNTPEGYLNSPMITVESAEIFKISADFSNYLSTLPYDNDIEFGYSKIDEFNYKIHDVDLKLIEID